MRIPRLFQSSDFSINQQLQLSNQNHRHATQVLRLKTDDKLILFNGKVGEYMAVITQSNKRTTDVSITAQNRVNRESTLHSTLVLAMIKPDKMDFAIHKAVELGVTRIQPAMTERSLIKSKRLDKKLQHWKGVIIAACEQSGRTEVPEILVPEKLENITTSLAGELAIAMLPNATIKFNQLPAPADDRVTLIIGPEGGFSHAEESDMLANSIHAVNFGKRILRSETAAIAGITTCQQLWGDL